MNALQLIADIQLYRSKDPLQKSFARYACLVLVGGIIGFVKAKSKASLIAPWHIKHWELRSQSTFGIARAQAQVLTPSQASTIVSLVLLAIVLATIKAR